MRDKHSTRDARAAKTAARQYGVISSVQLEQDGLDRRAISRRVGSGRLHRIHRGVYAVGHKALSHRARWMAAVLACGEGAVLSHRSAAELFTLLPAAVHPVHVTVPFSRRPGHAGIAVHRSRSLGSEVTTRRHRIPVTAPARTIADLRCCCSASDVHRATRQAEFLGLALEDVPTDGTRSELERMFLRLCRRYGLPRPAVNVRVGPHMVDFLFRRQGVAVETDGWQGHRGRQAFEDDRARDLDLKLAGFEVLRFTYRQVEHEAPRVAAALRTLLGADVRSS